MHQMVTGTVSMIDLFAGCGGMTAGFKGHGFAPVLAVEHNLYAAATYAANFGEDHTYWGDIAELLDNDLPQVDVVIGGPPCQGFSSLGGQRPDDPRNKLWQAYLEVVKRTHPKVFVIENVERFRASPEFELLLAESRDGSIRDYELTHGLLLAADFGVAQKRPRTFIIGSRIGRIDLPRPTHARTATGRLKEWRTVRQRIGELPPRPSVDFLPDSQTRFFGRMVPGTFKRMDLHFGRNPRELSLKRYKRIPPGGGRFDLPDNLLPDCWRRKQRGTTDVMGRMHWDAPSLTIRTEFFKPEKGRYLHPEEHRAITHLEAACLQDFPDNFLWCGSKTEIARQIGNAVPVGLASAVARQIKKYF